MPRASIVGFAHNLLKELNNPYAEGMPARPRGTYVCSTSLVEDSLEQSWR
ncbi:hypothetical protein ABIB06_002546 [Bradyrhizobium sp. LB8.2]